LLSGQWLGANTFTIEARRPRDTFQYQVNRTPYLKPVVDRVVQRPAGQPPLHPALGAMALSSPDQDLAGFAGQMLPDVGVEIITGQDFAPGANTTDLVVNLRLQR